jgi:hypothetical protein
MKIAFITPIGDLGYDYTDYHMALTHLVLKYPDYATYYKELAEEGDFVILDNSLIELGEAATLEKVLYAAKIINPSEIVLPDVFMEGSNTLSEVEKALQQLESIEYDYQLQAVCHGETENKWKTTWECLQNLPALDTIAIPKVTEKQFGSRTPFVKWALENNHNNKQIHLLGCWSDMEEFKEYTDEMKSKIRGVDTSITYHCAIDNTDKKPGWKIDLEHKYEGDVHKFHKNMLRKQQEALDIIK